MNELIIRNAGQYESTLAVGAAGQRSLAGRVEGPGEGLGRDRDATEGAGG